MDNEQAEKGLGSTGKTVDPEDVWTIISLKVGVDRQVVKNVIYNVLLSDKSMPALIKEVKIPIFTFKHIITEFDTWSGALD